MVAAEWSIEPSISFREKYNDNIRFTTSPHPGVWHSRLSPSLKLSGKTEVTEVIGSASFSINRYAGDPLVEDHNDKFLSLLTSFRSERDTWAVNASYKQDSTAESERYATGLVQTRTQRSAISLSPSWTRLMTERSSVKLDYSYQEVKYDAHINLNDFSNQRFGGTLQYRLSELDVVSLSANYSITDYSPTTNQYPDSINIDFGFPFGILPVPWGGTDTITTKSSMRGIQASGSHRFSETLRGSLSLGWRRVDTESTHVCNGQLGTFFLYSNRISCSGFATDPLVAFTQLSEGNGSSFSANLEKTFDVGTVSGFTSREINTSGSGLVETDKFGVSLNRNLTEKLTGSFDAIAYRTKYIGMTAPSSRFYTVEPKLHWRFTDWWALDAGYRYAHFEPDGATIAKISNMVYLNLAYNWQKMTISR